MKGFEQKPTPPNEWLYYDNEEGTRFFVNSSYIGNGGYLLDECTNDEKEQWERDHNPEPKLTEVVE